MNTINRLTHNNQNKIKYKHSFVTEINSSSNRKANGNRHKLVDYSLVKAKSCISLSKSTENVIYSNSKLQNKLDHAHAHELHKIKSNSLDDMTKDNTVDMSPYLSTVGHNMTFINDSFYNESKIVKHDFVNMLSHNLHKNQSNESDKDKNLAHLTDRIIIANVNDQDKNSAN